MLFSRIDLVNTYWSVVLIYVGMFIPEVILLMTSGFRGIPDELIEAAKLDGAGYFQVLRYVVVPMGRPAIILCIIFYFIVTWNDLFSADDPLAEHGQAHGDGGAGGSAVALLGRPHLPVRRSGSCIDPCYPCLCHFPALHH